MKTKKYLYFGFISLFCVSGFVVANFIQANQLKAKTSRKLGQFSFNGAWKYKPDESDFSLEMSRKLFLPTDKSAKKINTRQAEISALAVFLFPPEELLFEGDKNELTINETFKDLEQNRTLLLDGNFRPLKQNFGVELSIMAQENNDSLVVKTKSRSGNQLIETYKFFADGEKLRVIVQITDSAEREIVMLRRVYQRTTVLQFLPIANQSFD